MILLDTFDSDEEAAFVIDLLKKNTIQFSEKKGDAGFQVFINESDEPKINELIKTLD